MNVGNMPVHNGMPNGLSNVASSIPGAAAKAMEFAIIRIDLKRSNRSWDGQYGMRSKPSEVKDVIASS